MRIMAEEQCRRCGDRGSLWAKPYNIRGHTGDRNCWDCGSFDSCDKPEPREIERRITEYLGLRDCDEVAQMKAVHSALVTKL